MKNKQKYDRKKLLEKYVKEYIDFDKLLEIGFFTESLRYEYIIQAERIRIFFGYKSPFEFMFKHKPKDISAFIKGKNLIDGGIIPPFKSLSKYFKNQQKPFEDE